MTINRSNFDVIKNLTVNNAIASSRPEYKIIYLKLLLKGNYMVSIN